MRQNLLLLCHIFVLTSILFHSLIVYSCQVLPTSPVTHFRIYFTRFAFAFHSFERFSYSYWADFLILSQQSPLDPSLCRCNPTPIVSTQCYVYLHCTFSLPPSDGLFLQMKSVFKSCKLARSLLCCDVPGIAFVRVRQCYKPSQLAKISIVFPNARAQKIYLNMFYVP
jgi:hypothetical protein